VDRSPDFVSYIIRTAFEIAILYLIYRGYSFARWLLGIAGIIGCVLGVYSLTIISYYYFSLFTLAIVETVLTASIAGLLLIPRSVRVFQNAQRKSKKNGSIPV
jgi:hypothetical protein